MKAYLIRKVYVINVLYFNMPTNIKEKNYKCIDPQLGEIHKALIQEYEAVSKKQNEQKIILYNSNSY